MNTLVIHSLLTVVGAGLCFVVAWCTSICGRAVLQIRAERKRLYEVERTLTEDMLRLEGLERGQDRFQDSLARLNGRLGALVAKVNGIEPEQLKFGGHEIVPEDDDERKEAEREKLRAKLAEKATH